MSSMTSFDCDGPLYVERDNKQWEELYCIIADKKFQAFKKIREDLRASKSNRSASNVVVRFLILADECECKIVKYGISELAKIQKNSKMSETPFFFNIMAEDKVFKFAASTESERGKWIICVKNLAKRAERKSEDWRASAKLLDDKYSGLKSNRFSLTYDGNKDGKVPSQQNQMLPSSRSGRKLDKPLDLAASGSPLSRSNSIAAARKRGSSSVGLTAKKMSREGGVDDNSDDDDDDNDDEDDNNGDVRASMNDRNSLRKFQFELDQVDDADIKSSACCDCSQKGRLLGLKVDTVIRMLKVLTAYPFVIVVSSLNLSNKYKFLRSVTGIRVMNLCIFIGPIMYVKWALSEFPNPWAQRMLIAVYSMIYLLPVGFVVSAKLNVASSTSKIEEGTFCFKPARTVHLTQANFYAIAGFIFEWIQHITYVLPLGIVTSEEATKLSDFPPYLNFKVYFWGTVTCVFLAGLVVVLNAVLKGKRLYKLQHSSWAWFFVYNVGSPMYVTFVTILFMSLWCNYSANPPTLVQDENLVCYGEGHSRMARAGLISLAVYLIQHTLLPTGTFAETMKDDQLDIMFVPVYLQAHFFLKAIFCGVYVYFYKQNFIRVIALTAINIMLLVLNVYMKPCSVGWINTLRDTFFVHATLSGIQSINYLMWPINSSTKDMVVSTLSSNILFSTIGMYAFYRYTSRSTEYAIATAFLDLEWQVSRGGSVHPRVLEPLISLTLSTSPDDWDIAKKYIGQLVWLISYPNMRVQFQSAWGLANLALVDEDSRIKIHEAGGVKTLFEWYPDMEFVVQLETLAALANLTLSLAVAEDMVSRHKCIPFFLDLLSSNKLKHAQFSAIALANLARKETYRELIRKAGGITALVSCIMSHDYQKRRHGCRALANMVLSPSKETEQVFESKGLIDKIIKMAVRKEIETQREVVGLIRNLSCHARLRPILLDRGVMDAVAASKLSVFEDVQLWCEEITVLLQKEINRSGNIDLKSLRQATKTTMAEADVDLLRKMEPLKGQVEWSTWGSKLESIFLPVFSTIPQVNNSQLVTSVDRPMEVLLPNGLSRAQLLRIRDSLSYVVLEKPAHGKLNEYSTTSDFIVYTPHRGYKGNDFFTYRMNVGSVLQAPATVAINVVAAGDLQSSASDGWHQGVAATRGAYNNYNSDDSDEYDSDDVEQGRAGGLTRVRSRSPASPQQRGRGRGAGSSPDKRSGTGHDKIEIELSDFSGRAQGRQRAQSQSQSQSQQVLASSSNNRTKSPMSRQPSSSASSRGDMMPTRKSQSSSSSSRQVNMNRTL